MARETNLTVHSMPIDTLRVRAREAFRLIEQARALVRETRGAPDAGREKQVGATLDAIERLLPGIGALGVQRAERVDRGQRDSGITVSTPRERTREQIERAEIIAMISDTVASLLCDIERVRTSTVMRTLEIPSSSSDVTMPAPRRS